MNRLFQYGSPRVVGFHRPWVVQVFIDPVGNGPVEVALWWHQESAGRLTPHIMRLVTLAKGCVLVCLIEIETARYDKRPLVLPTGLSESEPLLSMKNDIFLE
jgi:hypothetical protein